MEKEGRLLHDRWWLDPSFKYGDATMRPSGMTPEELTRGCFEARKAFNTWRSFFYRMTAWRTNTRSPYRAGVYMFANLVSRREIYRKQQRELGQGVAPLRDKHA